MSLSAGWMASVYDVSWDAERRRMGLYTNNYHTKVHDKADFKTLPNRCLAQIGELNRRRRVRSDTDIFRTVLVWITGPTRLWLRADRRWKTPGHPQGLLLRGSVPVGPAHRIANRSPRPHLHGDEDPRRQLLRLDLPCHHPSQLHHQ